MRLSKQTSDAIEILVFSLRPDDNLVKVGEIAEELGFSKQMALKLSYNLGQIGYLEAVRGPRGGVRLTEAARNARLGDIVQALEAQPFDQRVGSAAFKKYVDEAFDAFMEVLNTHTLADLAKGVRRSKAAAQKAQAGQKGKSAPKAKAAAGAANKTKRAARTATVKKAGPANKAGKAKTSGTSRSALRTSGAGKATARSAGQAKAPVRKRAAKRG